MKSRLAKVILLALVAIVCVSKIASSDPPSRNDPTIARDSSVVPTTEANLTKLVISDDNDHTIDLSSLGFVPLILEVRADGNFHAGQVAPNQSNDIYYDGGQVWHFPVSSRLTWHCARQSGAGTVTLLIKALGSN